MDVEKEAADKLSRERWTFYIDALGGGVDAKVQIKVTRYRKETRPSLRHRTYKVVERWGNAERHYPGRILLTCPRLPDEEVLDALRARSVVVWPEDLAAPSSRP